jgi:hypothetical protein
MGINIWPFQKRKPKSFITAVTYYTGDDRQERISLGDRLTDDQGFIVGRIRLTNENIGSWTKMLLISENGWRSYECGPFPLIGVERATLKE